MIDHVSGSSILSLDSSSAVLSLGFHPDLGSKGRGCCICNKIPLRKNLIANLSNENKDALLQTSCVSAPENKNGKCGCLPCLFISGVPDHPETKADTQGYPLHIFAIANQLLDCFV